jgi:pimeloyl-ACP methyl ester carboxylesterase
MVGYKHGMNGNHIMPALAKNYTVIVTDLRRFGESSNLYISIGIFIILNNRKLTKRF